MSILLADALRELALQPGESRCVTVDDYAVEIRRSVVAVHDEGPMVDIFLDMPPSPNARMIKLVREPILPDPIEITDSDLAPE